MYSDKMQNIEYEIEKLGKTLSFGDYMYRKDHIAINPLEFNKNKIFKWTRDLNLLIKLIKRITVQSIEKDFPINSEYKELIQQYKIPLESDYAKYTVSRPDCIVVNGELKIIEFNIDSAVGGFWELEKIQKFLKMNDLSINGIYPSPKKYWIKMFEKIAKKYNRPIYVGIVGSSYLEPYNVIKVQEVTTWLNDSEWVIAKYIQPEDLTLQQNQIADQDYRYDILYRYRSILHSSHENKEMIELYKKAHTSHTIVISSINDLLIEQKFILALLYNLQQDKHNLFTNEEKDIINKYIPWTKSLNCNSLEFQGKVYEPFTLLTLKQELFVLKRMYSHHGNHVVIGAQTKKLDWKNKCIEIMVSNPHEWVVQERLISDKVELFYPRNIKKKKHYFFSPYFFGENFAGAFIRIQQDSKQQILSTPSLSPMGMAGLKILL